MRIQRTKEQRKFLYDKMDGKCGYCGTKITFEQMQLDHIEPLHVGGQDEINNLLCACRSCNNYKHTLTVEKYREYIITINRRLLNNVTFKHALRFEMIAIVDKETLKFYFEGLSMKYKCIKEMYLPRYDGDGFISENYCGLVPVNSIWYIDDTTNIIGGEIHLVAISGVEDYGWIEISKQTLISDFEVYQ